MLRLHLFNAPLLQLESSSLSLVGATQAVMPETFQAQQPPAAACLQSLPHSQAPRGVTIHTFHTHSYPHTNNSSTFGYVISQKSSFEAAHKIIGTNSVEWVFTMPANRQLVVVHDAAY